MRAASCFSGIGGAESAFPDADWLWCAEIEPAPAAILATRFPGTTNLGDVLAADFIERAKAFGQIDLLCGGPPCQAFSVAGLRGGMSDPRGQLSIRFVEIAHAIRPRNLLVENVPGWLNHEDNAFGCFLGAIVGADDALLPSPHPGGRRGNDNWRWLAKEKRLVPAWPRNGMAAGPICRVAWTVKDAQHFGLAQRRERVFLVVDFGEGADPAAVLFERDCGVGNPTARRKAGEGVTGTLSARTEGGGGLGTDFDLAGGCQPVGFGGGNCSGPINVGACLTAKGQRVDFEVETFIAEKARTLLGKPNDSHSADLDTYIAHTLRAEGFDASEDGTGRGTPLVPVEVAPCMNAGGNDTGGDRQYGMAADTATALIPISYRTSGNCGAWDSGDRVDALTTGTDPNSHLIAFSAKDHGADATADLSPTLRLMGHADSHADSHANGGGQVAIAMQAGMVRENPASGPDGKGWQPDLAYTLEARAEVQAVAFDTTQITSPSKYSNPQPGDPCHPVTATAHVPLAAIAEPFTIMERGRDGKSNLEYRQDGTANAILTPNGGRGGRGGLGVGAIATQWAVRRLTCAECEFLQGYPPGHTLIETNKRRTVDVDEAEYLRAHGAIVTEGNDGRLRTNALADGPRYKALGNAWAVPCAAWIIKRIAAEMPA